MVVQVATTYTAACTRMMLEKFGYELNGCDYLRV